MYIGQTRNLARRLGEHRTSLRNGDHRNKRLQADYDQYGLDTFELIIISTDKDKLDEVERSQIEAARADGMCYNVFSGGLTGYTGDEEFRQKMSVVHTGRKISDEEKKRRAESARRQWQDPAFREKMRQSAKRQWQDGAYRNMMVNLHTGGVDACGHKLTAEIVANARYRYRGGEKISDLAKEYGVTYCSMRSAVVGETWKHIT